MPNIRVAWLLTSAFYYWHPMLAYFAKQYPNVRAFAANWPGYATGYEDSFDIDVVGERKVIPLVKSETGYGSNFTYLPLTIVSRLFRFQPQVIFSNSFGIWTILALLCKPFGGWRVVIAYEGSSPSVDHRNSPLRLLVRKVMVRAADACITNSRAGKSYLVDQLQADDRSIFAHPYEVPAADALGGPLAASASPLPALAKPTFLYVGGVIPRKGLHYLLKACTMLQKRRVGAYTLLVVGDGPQRLELEAFCRDHALTGTVRWVGHVDYRQLGMYFSQADVFVLPTLEDTWGMVVLEAMVVGKPILCSKRAGASELVVDGENGYCFDPYEPERLADLMEAFVKAPEQARVMGQRSMDIMRLYQPEDAAQFLHAVVSYLLPGQVTCDD